MTQACCSHQERLRSSCGVESQPRIIGVMGENLIIFLLSLLLGGHRAIAVAGTLHEPVDIDAFQTFLLRGQHQQNTQSHRKVIQKNGSESPLPWSSSKSFKNGARGVGLTLVHRDARNSPFRASSSLEDNVDHGEPEFATIFQKWLQRDAARVRAIDSIVTKLQPTTTTTTVIPSRSAHGNGPPLMSPLEPGLDFGSGEYFTIVSFGSPPIEVLVTIDTGSDLIWLQCHPCDNCYDQIGPIFNPGASGSYETVPCYSRACGMLPRSTCNGMDCQYVEEYGDGSFSRGELASETVTMNSTQGLPFSIPGVLFGCGHDNEGLFASSGGLLGLGRGHLSFPSQIANVLVPRFSYCLTDRFTSFSTTAANTSSTDCRTDGHTCGNSVCHGRDGAGKGKDGEAGIAENDDDDGADGDDGEGMTATSYLFFGEAESEGKSMKYTALLRNPTAPTFYYLQLTGISVANELVKIPASALDLDMSSGRGGVIMDTGTAVSRFSSYAYEAMRDAFRWKAKHLKRVVVPNQELFETCFQLSEGQAVPVVALHFAGAVDMVMPVDNTIIPVDDSGLQYCFAFARSEGQGDISIIGNVQQQGFRIEFDLRKGKVGISQQDC